MRTPRAHVSVRVVAKGLAIVLTVVVWSSCGSLVGSAGACHPQTNESPIPSQSLLRTIPLDDRWTGGNGALCFSDIRVSDGRFLIVGHPEGTPSVADPWFAALRGFSHSTLSDDNGIHYAISFIDARPGRPTVIGVDDLLPPKPGIRTGDLLAGAHVLTMEVQNVLEQVDGPWVFRDIPAHAGPLEVAATAAGRELRLYDLVISADSFLVGFMELGGGNRPPFVGIRSPYAEFASARDATGKSYAVVGPKRTGSGSLLYMEFTGVPPGDGRLTITLERIFVSTDRTWRGTIRLP